jgi:hypothetical protein
MDVVTQNKFLKYSSYMHFFPPGLYYKFWILVNKSVFFFFNTFNDVHDQLKIIFIFIYL